MLDGAGKTILPGDTVLYIGPKGFVPGIIQRIVTTERMPISGIERIGHRIYVKPDSDPRGRWWCGERIIRNPKRLVKI